MSIKISQLPSASAVTADDLLPVVDDIGGTPITRKATIQQVLRFITGSTFDTLNVTQLTSSEAQIDALSSTNIDVTVIQASNITASVVSASTFIGLPTSVSASGPEKSVQFNSSSQFSGSANLTFDYTTSILSGVTAQFTTISSSNITGSTAQFTTISTSNITGSIAQFNTITASNITGSTAQFTTLSASNGEFSGDVIIYGTASLDANPEAAYIIYSSSLDKIVIFPGLSVIGDIDATNFSIFDLSASSIDAGDITTNTISASSYIGLPSITLEKTLVSASISLSASQRAVFAINNITSSLTITMPSVSTADSREYHIIKADSLTGSVFISGSSPDLINGQTSFELNGPYQSITLISDGTNWFVF